MKRLSLVFILLFALLSVDQGFALTSKVLITSGGSELIRSRVQENLSNVMNALKPLAPERFEQSCTREGLTALIGLKRQTGFFNVNPLYECRLLELDNGLFEVRDIKVKVDLGSTKGNPFQYLVFTFTPAGKIAEVRFGMERQHYSRLIEEGQALEDFVFRQQILHFIEIFRTAYNRKDLEYLRQVFSDDALIIVGKVLQEKENAPNMLESSYLGQDQIQFIKLSKNEYIERLKPVFVNNSFIKVQFEEIEIIRHHRIPEIYGVKLKQNWRSDSYSDTGYLFLMIDFIDPDKPLIHVRTWQSEKFPDGSIISLGDFEIIE
ncbi:MAG: hypothetical protein U9Q77_06510 [Candidatus Marinimicrobia bacterium]|nr:hypothetical protein [Candidatus Neomarinimicrobiota bacterium]